MIEFINTKKDRLKKKLLNTLNKKSSMSALAYAIVNERIEIASILIKNGA